MTALVDIVIVNWNARDFLSDCLESIAAHGGGLVGRVVVVDNGSTDGSAEIAAGFTFVDLIRCEQNHGFARASNIGAARCDAPYLLFFNPDAALKPDCIETAVRFMESPDGRTVGVCGCRLLDGEGRTQRRSARFPPARVLIAHMFGLGRMFPRLFSPLFMTDFDHLSSRPVDHVIGAFYLVRRDLFRHLEGFDERFFVYLEDLDFSYRAKAAGWQVYYLADAVAYHEGGGISDQVRDRRLFYSRRSRVLYAFKHFGRSPAWTVVFFTLLVEPVLHIAWAAVRASGAEIGEVARGYRMLWRDLPAILRVAFDKGSRTKTAAEPACASTAGPSGSAGFDAEQAGTRADRDAGDHHGA